MGCLRVMELIVCAAVPVALSLLLSSQAGPVLARRTSFIYGLAGACWQAAVLLKVGPDFVLTAHRSAQYTLQDKRRYDIHHL